MTCSEVLTLLGLVCITLGSIGAALASPSPKYNADGSVSLAGEPDLAKRVSMHRWQKHFRTFLLLVAFGAILQAIAVFIA